MNQTGPFNEVQLLYCDLALLWLVWEEVHSDGSKRGVGTLGSDKRHAQGRGEMWWGMAEVNVGLKIVFVQ